MTDWTSLSYVVVEYRGLFVSFLMSLNEQADKPDLAVILDADPEVIAQRLEERGAHNRFQLTPDSSRAEVEFYREATERLIRGGFNVMVADVSHKPPEQIAALIGERLQTLLALRRM